MQSHHPIDWYYIIGHMSSATVEYNILKKRLYIYMLNTVYCSISMLLYSNSIQHVDIYQSVLNKVCIT